MRLLLPVNKISTEIFVRLNFFSLTMKFFPNFESLIFIGPFSVPFALLDPTSHLNHSSEHCLLMLYYISLYPPPLSNSLSCSLSLSYTHTHLLSPTLNPQIFTASGHRPKTSCLIIDFDVLLKNYFVRSLSRSLSFSIFLSPSEAHTHTLSVFAHCPFFMFSYDDCGSRVKTH